MNKGLYLSDYDARAIAAKYPTIAKDIFDEVKSKRRYFDAILYHRHKPTTETTYKYFETLTSGETNKTYTNIITAGKLPWSGDFKINALALIIDPLIVFSTTGTDRAAMINTIINGNWAFNVGDTKIDERPLYSLFSQLRCCSIYRSQATAADQFDSIVGMTAPGLNKYGYLVLPEGPVIESTDKFDITVNWEAAPGGSNVMYLGFFLLGKRITPITV